MRTPSTEESLDQALIYAMSLAEETYAHLDRFKDGAPEHLGRAPEQPGQWDDDGTLRKVARAHLPGTSCYVDVSEEEVGSEDDLTVSGWEVRILDSEGAVLYECGPGGFDLKAAAAAVPPLPTE